MYDTGDLARYLPNGDIDFIGRADNLIKIRGYRIDLGDIDNALHSYSLIEDCIVIIKDNLNNEYRLIAYYIKSKNTTESIIIEELREYLKDKLPQYMIPEFFIELEDFPLTANRKIDRKKLPEPNIDRSSLSANYIKATTHLELKIEEIWKSVLHIDEISITDSFFSIGGNSLTLIQVYKKMTDCLTSELPEDFAMVRLFRYPTIQSISEHITGRINRSTPSEADENRIAKRKEALKKRTARKAR